MLSRITTWLREPVIKRDAASAGNERIDTIEHRACLRILVEATVDEFAEKSCALRAPPPISLIDTGTPVVQRIANAGNVMRFVAQKRDQVADTGEAETENGRILGGVDELIDPAAFESGGQETVAG